MSSETPEPVLLYGRISEDTTKQGVGVADQLQQGRELAKLRGWDVVGEHADNDVTALHGDHRPGYQEVMAAAARGTARRIVVMHTSRLWRNRRERAEGIEILAKARVSVAVIKGTDLDLTSAQGRGMAGIIGEFDTWESEVKSERVRAAAIRRAKEGRTNGAVMYGWTRCHRYNDSGKMIGWDDVVNEAEAAVVREITDRLLSGDTLLAVTADLNRRGVPAPGATHRANVTKRARENPDGTAWGKTSVKKMAIRPANASRRIFHRGQPDEALLDGSWPPLVPRDRWERVVALMTDPSRRRERPASRQHLLTWGLGECGVCGGNLRVATKSKKYVLYVCDPKGCTGRNEAAVDDLVALWIAERMSRPDAWEWLQVDGDDDSQTAGEEAAALRARLDIAADQYADEKIEHSQLERITAKLRPKIDDAERRARRHIAPLAVDALQRLAGPEAAETWEAMPLSARRAVLESIGLVVRILPVTRRGANSFDPDTVEIFRRRA